MASLLKVNDDDVVSQTAENRLKLALQSLYVVGPSFCDANSELRQLPFNADDGFCDIAAGKEFLLMTTASGKVFFLLLL